MAAAIAAAFLVAGPSLAASPAYAAGSQTVNFTGGSVLNLLVCKSDPSPSRVAVSAGSRVMFVNRLGQAATLRVNGSSVAAVGANQAVPVVFHYGPVAVSMTFDCGAGLAEKFSAATVTVAPSTASAPMVGGARTSGSLGGGTAAGTTRGGTAGDRPAAGIPGKAPEGTGASTATGAQVDPATGLPSADPSEAGLDPALAGGAPGARASGRAVAVEPLVPASGTPTQRASSLLALLATVCVIGVTITATRAIISKRTMQASLA